MYSGTLDPPFRPDEASFRHAEERKELSRKLRENSYSFSSPSQKETWEEINPVTEERKCEQCEQNEQTESNERNPLAALSGLKTEEIVILFLLALLFAENEKRDIVGIAILLYLLLFE